MATVPIASDIEKKINSLGSLVYGLLSNQSMTHKELADCLMSEPYSLPWSDLSLVVIALNNLSEADLLMVTFRANNNILGIEPVFRASLRKHRP